MPKTKSQDYLKALRSLARLPYAAASVLDIDILNPRVQSYQLTLRHIAIHKLYLQNPELAG